MRNRHLAVLGAAVVALVLPAGCGGADKPAAGGQPVPAATAAEETSAAAEDAGQATSAARPDACTLVSKADAEKLAGTRLDDAVAVRESCTYTAPVTGPTAQVEVYVGDGAKKYLDIERDLGHEVRALSGVGDEAHVTMEAFFIRKGDVWLAVRLMRLNDPAANRKPLGGPRPRRRRPAVRRPPRSTRGTEVLVPTTGPPVAVRGHARR
ncbi:hypothetical protein ONA91_16595 [Micromonospora sp. DR5-3]|uniref:hypothetical protein n=1 Tax=unclassified Micromonospora TaxID=2617518 RepID=UPI002105709C|nr:MULTISPECIES: hypothetical protein [unclassified Micromonospora]MCW3816062.1 hypothetical protein [Micromonospora sp. DR5-3]